MALVAFSTFLTLSSLTWSLRVAAANSFRALDLVLLLAPSLVYVHDAPVREARLKHARRKGELPHLFATFLPFL